MSETRLQQLKGEVAIPAAFATASGLLQRKCHCGTHTMSGSCDECAKKKSELQRKSAHGIESSEVPQSVHEVLRSSGQRLDADTRAFFEPRFGHDFSQVRVHTDMTAAASAHSVNALAYTVGRNVVFGQGQYSPQTSAGRQLIAHELAHVVQQNGQQTGPSPIGISDPGSHHEHEADNAARDVMANHHARGITSAPPKIHRQRPGSGDLRLAERRDAAEAQLPVPFPDTGIRVIGSGANALLRILSSCTTLVLSLDANQMVTIAAGPANPGTQTSTTARTELLRILRGPGIIVDTNPAGAGVTIGVFGMDTPGYQQIDVGNVQVLGGATGVRGGLSACDAVMHEIAEASHGRALSQASLSAYGRRAYDPSHAEGTRVEQGIRGELGLPQRSATEHGDLVQLGNESANTLVLLESMVFGDGAQARTQLSVIRCRLLVTGPQQMTCDNEVVASTVVQGVVRFKTPAEALAVFNQRAAAFGLRPIPVPAAPARPNPAPAPRRP